MTSLTDHLQSASAPAGDQQEVLYNILQLEKQLKERQMLTLTEVKPNDALDAVSDALKKESADLSTRKNGLQKNADASYKKYSTLLKK